MKKLFKACVLWFTISNLISSCTLGKRNYSNEKPEDTVVAQPAPLQDLKTDSLKNYLDAEREKRRK
jgi:hypothetical protein